MKIVYLTNNVNPNNGWGRYASDLIFNVQKSGHETIVLKEIEDDGEGVIILKRGLGVFSSAFKIRKYLKDAEIVHAFDVYPYGMIAYLANLFLGKKLIISAQGTYSIAPFGSSKTKYLAKLVCRSADMVIAISNFTKKELLKQTHVKRIEVLNHGIDLAGFYQERAATSASDFILSVGALKFRKGYHISIPAFSLIKKQFPNLKYKIIGSQKDKKYFETLKQIVRADHLEEDVEFLTNISDQDLKKIYSEAKLFILTSINEKNHFEGFGLVFLEAAAAGLPVIGTSDNGIQDALQEGFNGFLVPQNDIQKTAGTISALLSDPDMLERMSRNSHDWARQHDLKKAVSAYIDLYRALLP